MERLTERAEIDKCPGIWLREEFANDGLKTWFNGYDEGYSAINKCAEYEDLEEQCIKENSWGLKILLKKWKEFFEDIQELYEYRKLKEQGKLLELPCAVGDIVYQNMTVGINEKIKYKVSKAKVYKFSLDSYTLCFWTETVDKEKYQIGFPLSAFGKTVFFTKEEAEQALKEKVKKADNGNRTRLSSLGS